jgi:hypothetical protein
METVHYYNLWDLHSDVEIISDTHSIEERKRVQERLIAENKDGHRTTMKQLITETGMQKMVKTKRRRRAREGRRGEGRREEWRERKGGKGRGEMPPLIFRNPSFYSSISSSSNLFYLSKLSCFGLATHRRRFRRIHQFRVESSCSSK